MNPRQKAVREARNLMRLGSEDPVCFFCGESNPNRLMRLRGHHLTGWKRDPSFQVIICFNCHHELHLRAPVAGATFGKREGRAPARTASRLRALALSRDMEAEHLRRWADELDNEERKKISDRSSKGKREITTNTKPSGRVVRSPAARQA